MATQLHQCQVDEKFSCEYDEEVGDYTIRWMDTDGNAISLIVFPDGKLMRVISPYEEGSEPVTTHILDLVPTKRPEPCVDSESVLHLPTS